MRVVSYSLEKEQRIKLDKLVKEEVALSKSEMIRIILNRFLVYHLERNPLPQKYKPKPFADKLKEVDPNFIQFSDGTIRELIKKEKA